MSPSNSVTLSGQIASEMPSPGRGRTALFKIERRQAAIGRDGSVQVTGFVLWCRCWGHASASVLKYGKPGVEVVVSGRLNYLSEMNAVGIVVDSVSYPRPSQLAESDKSASD